MEQTIGSRLKHAWNAFKSSQDEYKYYGPTVETHYSSMFRPRQLRNEKSIITSIYTRIASDASSIKMKHVKTDLNGNFKEEINSGLNECLTIEANMDQTGRAFMQDIIISLLDEGCVIVAPIDTTISPKESASYQINSMRTGKVLEWYPSHIKGRFYNDRTGKSEELVFPKKLVAIIENPFYSIMNEPNSTLQRLINKLNILDIIDEQSSSGKLDLIIQLPYTIKTDTRKKQADKRREDLENQLKQSKFGVAYADATEKITQLNRPIENKLLSQIEYLTKMLYSQLGVTEGVLDGTADEKTMLNYYNRTIEPILSAIADEFKRKILTKTARTQGQSIMYFRDSFKLVPTSQLADLANSFTRNEIMSSNEFRQIIGLKPSDDPKADELRNSNMPQYEPYGDYYDPTGYDMDYQYDQNNLEMEENQNG